MKAKKLGILGIAGALVLGYAGVSKAGVELKAGENSKVDLGVWTQVNYTYKAKRENSGDSENVISVKDMRVTLDGELTKNVQFYGDIVSEDGNGFNLEEGGINIVINPYAEVRIGKVVVPFTRQQLVSSYYSIVPSGFLYDVQNIYNNDALMKSGDGVGPASIIAPENAGAILHGEFADGIVRYSIGLFNQETREDKTNNGFGIVGRIEITPVTFGFKPAPQNEINGWEKDTYFGKEGNILTFGVGVYRTTLIDQNAELWRVGGVTIYAPDDLVLTGWTGDVFGEFKVPGSPVIINVAGSYIYLKNSHYYLDNNPKKGDTNIYTVQLQGLYDQAVGFGKPAIFFMYQGAKADYVNSGKSDATYSRFGVGINYYIKGDALKATLGLDNVKYDDAAEAYLNSAQKKDSITDIYAQIQLQF